MMSTTTLLASMYFNSALPFYVLALAATAAPAALRAGSAYSRDSIIPYIATRHDAVQAMLWLAEVGKDDVVYDLGSGDGRIVIAAVRDFGARRAVGIELDEERIRLSRDAAREAGVADRAEFIHGDLFTIEVREASVVCLFLGHAPNLGLRPSLLRALRPGARIVSHQFGMGEWIPDKRLSVRTVYFGMWGEAGNPFAENPNVPDYTGNEMHYGTNDVIMQWIVPAPVAGVWRGTIPTKQGPRECELMLHQRLSAVTGSLRLAGQTNLAATVSADLWGSHLRFEGHLQLTETEQTRVRFDGRVEGDTMQGNMAWNGAEVERPVAWQAHRTRDDFTGTWAWPCATGPRPVRLRIVRDGGSLAATYLDQDHALPVTDLYDTGGGFCFTLLIGRDGSSVRITEDTGWLIGEAILQDGTLTGSIDFYPYPGLPGEPGNGHPARPVNAQWSPSLAEPGAVRSIRGRLPAGWTCAVVAGDTVERVPHGLARPVYEVVLANTNLWFEASGMGRNRPIIPLFFYRQEDKADLLRIIERERVFSWDIPVYFGETDDFVVVTSPAYVNGGVFTLEARRALRPMWAVLRELIPNKENSQVDELARDEE